MSDWFFDDGSAATLLQSDVLTTGGEMLGAWDGATSSATTAQYGTTQNDDGSTTVEGVVVTGPTYESDGGGAGGGGGWWEGLDLTDTITPGEGEPTCPMEQPPTTDEELDEATDAKAKDVADFLSQFDLTTQEFGVLIYLDSNGVVRAGQVAVGTYEDASGEGRPIVQPDPTGIDSYTQIIGYVHNHPSYGGAPIASDNRPSSDDWAMMNALFNPPDGRPGADPGKFRHYIIGPDGVLREFKPEDQHNTSQGEVVTSGGTCGGGL